MKLLLDTHIFLWFVSDDQRLREKYRGAICDSANEVYLSVASLWECVIKHSLGKLQLPSNTVDYLTLQRERHGIQSLPIDERCVARLSELPRIHRDPFDRILICQAIQHGFHIVTEDKLFTSYPVTLFQE